MNGTVHAFKPKIKSGIFLESVTPQMAAQWLQTMVGNRPLSQGKAIEYAIVMEEGQWKVNGETVKFDDQGRLIDGQHRLQACMLADKSFKTYVAYGISDEDAFATIDVGKTRSHGDIFGIAGYPSSNIASGAALLVYQYKNGLISMSGDASRRMKKGSAKFLAKLDKLPVKAVHVTKEQLLSFAEPFKDRLIGAVRFADAHKSKFLTKNIIAGCYLLFSEKSDVDAKAFFVDLAEGVGLSSSDPVYRLRERLISNHASMHKLKRGALLMLLFKAWNKRRAGEKLKMAIKLVEGEEFPKLR